MTVKELKEIIKDIPDDVVVFVNGYEYDYNMAYCNGKIENYSYVKDASSCAGDYTQDRNGNIRGITL